MKKYFTYEFKKSLFLIGCLTIIATVLCLVQFISIRDESAGLSSLMIVSCGGGFFAFCVPFWAFRYKMKKRSIDLFYALPLSHTKIIIVKYLVGLAVVYIPYTVAFWISFLMLAAMSQGLLVIYCIPLYFASIIPIYLIYAISSFAYTRANKWRDGQTFAVFWFFAVALIVLILARLTSRPLDPNDAPTWGFIYSEYFLVPTNFIPYAPLTYVVIAFTELITTGSLTFVTGAVAVGNMCAGFVFIALWGIASTVGLILLEKKAKAENAEQISNSWFGYKTLIPIYTTCIISLCSGLGSVSVIFVILVLIAMFAVSASYKRTVKIGWKQLIVLGVSAVAGIVLYFLSNIYF